MITTTRSASASWRSVALALTAAFTLCISPTVLAGETITFFHNDVAGSPALATDSNGIQAWKETYRPYGDQLVDSSAAQNNNLWFTGKSFDDSTGLSYMGARYYDPTLGRFMAVDPVSFDLGNLHSFNRYAYANNNPYRYVDPTGEFAITAVEAVVIGGGILIVGCHVSGSCEQFGRATWNFFASLPEQYTGSLVMTLAVLAEASKSASETGEGKTATANPDGSVTDAQGNKVEGASGGPGSGKRFPAESPDEKAAKEGVPCTYCGEPTTNEHGKSNSRERDHIKAKSKGGNNSEDNSADTCRSCNRGKGANDVWTWVKERFQSR